MLAIEVELLTGRYVATAYNTREEAEWPPHPARLFSALAATHFGAAVPGTEERAALEWLESQGPPAIRAAAASRREVVTVFVPVNDVALTDVDGESAALDEAQAALRCTQDVGDARALRKAENEVRRAEKRLSDAVARATKVPATGGNPTAAARVLPEGRVRQPRTFPSVTPEDPCITYLWPEAEAPAPVRAALDRLLQQLARLGHSSSLVAARLVDEPAAPVLRPFEQGELMLRTVQPGQLAALERAYARHQETEPRVLPARFQAYTTRTPMEEARIPCSSFTDDWLVLRRVGGPALPMAATAGLARSVRRALMARAAAVPEVLSGHAADGAPTTRPHLAIVPLPFVGHPHASGAILGIALVLPRAGGDAERRAVYAAVDDWERAERCEDEDTPRLHVRLGEAGVLELERVEWAAAQASLRPATWCRPARVWLSATPMALDRNPGNLRSRDPGKVAAAVAEAEAAIRSACERIDLPQPERVEVLPAAPLAGAAKTRHYPSFPGERDRLQRVLVHVRLDFGEPVRGPVLLGAGRFTGLGLFRPGDFDC